MECQYWSLTSLLNLRYLRVMWHWSFRSRYSGLWAFFLVIVVKHPTPDRAGFKDELRMCQGHRDTFLVMIRRRRFEGKNGRWKETIKLQELGSRGCVLFFMARHLRLAHASSREASSTIRIACTPRSPHTVHDLLPGHSIIACYPRLVTSSLWHAIGFITFWGDGWLSLRKKW